MCGIGGILRIHAPGSPEAARLRAHLEAGAQHPELGSRHARYELFHQRCVESRPVAEPVDAGPQPYGAGAAAAEGSAWTIEERWLDILENAVAHRGPDGRGRFRDAALRPDGSVVEVALIHRRLSIIDHEGGAQPMVSPRGRDDSVGLVAVVFNGCLYNHRELRAELEAKGHVFETDHSDTEVLIHGWREWGDGFHRRLDGMYVFLLWDQRRGLIARARDRAGEKQIYSDYIGNCNVLCSQPTGIAQLRAHVGATAPNKVDCTWWIEFGFENSLPWAEWAQPRPWESLSVAFSAIPGKSEVVENEYFIHVKRSRSSTLTVEDVDHLLRKAVGDRVESDAPLGCFLSGGVDSSLIARFAADAVPGLKTFCVRMPDLRYDESAHAGQAANIIGSRHTTLEAEARPADDLVALIEWIGLPFGDSSLLPTYWLCRAAKQEACVALSGDGGDELFMGYDRYIAAMYQRRWRWLLALTPSPLLPRRDPKSISTRIARLGDAARNLPYVDLLAIFPSPMIKRLLNQRERTWGRLQDPVEWDLEHYLPDDLLRKTDFASMFVGLEVRAPFLAKDVIEAATRVPLRALLLNGERKGLLRAVARKYFPAEIVDRPKMGFAIPIGEWFRSDYGGMRQLLYDQLGSAEPFGPASLGIEGMIDMGFVRRMMREHDEAGERSVWPWRGRDHSQRLYMLLVLSIWARWLGRVGGAGGAGQAGAGAMGGAGGTDGRGL